MKTLGISQIENITKLTLLQPSNHALHTIKVNRNYLYVYKYTKLQILTVV